MISPTFTAKGPANLQRELIDYHGVRSENRLLDLAGCLHDDGQPTLSIDDINAVIADGWAGAA